MNKSILWASISMLIVGVATGYLLFGNDNAAKAVGERLVQGSAQSLSQEEKKPLFYRSSMNPDVTSPSPAKDAMGMDYVPVYADNEASKVVGTVKINPVVVQNIGVRTAIAQRTSLSRTIRAVGRVDFDEERTSRLHPKVEGWVEEMRVDKTGQAVAKDDVLLSIYSPKLVSTQQEYLLALNNLSTLSKSPFEEIRKGAEQLVKSSLERLQLLDVPTHQIKKLERTRTIQKTLHIHAPVNGTVIRIGARQGQFVTPNTELYMMVDLNKVWVYAEVYEYELPWVKLGDEVEMTLASVPGKTFKGSLSYIYPYAESKTRTTKLRLIFDNSESLLRPDMFAQLSIHSDPLDDVIVIPAEAVIRTGDRTQVFIVRGPGKFEPRIVTLGIESNGQVAVLAGVDAGDEVVTSAQFLIDSESKLREATAKMMAVLKEAGSAATDGATGEGGDKAMEDTDPSNSERADHSKPETQGAPVHD
ncbi:efflux RND transporter periplasmic adaptor subunit [Dasania marina]|uniref:efflux RND transporter periplasmic adaptor subunit n=1 Tax=Dasania marina TaxID=471499 RepID=UPI0030DD5B0D|tara:strand:+ start:2119 stop:3537 length:1419 start_codon:yes stop_codon:yes gene_type:complete